MPQWNLDTGCSTSAPNQTCGSSPTVPDDWDVVDLLNHSRHTQDEKKNSKPFPPPLFLMT